MKKIPLVIVHLVALATMPAISQTEGGSWELSLAGNAGSLSSSYEYSGGGQSYSGEGEAQGYFGLDFRTGYYLIDGFSLEPEVYWLAIEKVPPTFNIGANAAYTFVIPQAPVRPYLTAGYGVGNGIPLMQRLIDRSSDKLDIPVLRLGGGLKILLSKSVALKLEYRYERYSKEETNSFFYSSYTSKVVTNLHNFLFGFSVFLPGGE